MASSLQPVSRSADFWFDDGNLILQVEATQFRVHRGLICASSAVFRDMHAVSQPEPEDTVDGCPVVCLPGDTTADWNNLLEYIYFPAKASQEGFHFPFPRVASMIRLGSKYDFAEIRSLALRTLRTQVPGDLEAWDKVFVHPSRRLLSWSATGGLITTLTGCIPGDWLDGHHFDLLNLALEQGLQTFLPLAYYLCIHEYDLKDILGGIEREDGTLATIHPGALPTLLLGRQALHARYSTATMSWLTSGAVPAPSCSRTFGFSEPTGNPELDSLTSCQYSRLNGLVQLAASHPDEVGALDTLIENWDPGFCEGCVEEIRNTSDRQRRKIYEDLPSVFNLPRWSQLKDRE